MVRFTSAGVSAIGIAKVGNQWKPILLLPNQLISIYPNNTVSNQSVCITELALHQLTKSAAVRHCSWSPKPVQLGQLVF